MSNIVDNSPVAVRDEVRRSLRMSSWEAILAMPLVYTGQPVNLVLAALLAEGLQLDPGSYGFIVSLPFWCNMLQLFVTPTLNRWFAIRRVFITSIWMHIACWTELATTLIVAPEWSLAHAVPVAAGFVGVAGMGVAVMGVAVMGVAWTAYMQAWCREEFGASILSG
ncbi:MAG: hypothetical protein J6386_07950 [Candidatus Synoicihabitans palmerolidicus]|nr:hypothetical protein [Candidatus Synoicihabitans palmerolidicus]